MGMNWKKPPWEQGGNATPPPKKPWVIDVPEIKPLSIMTSTAIFAGAAFIGFGIGSFIASIVFFGLVSLGGLIVLAESNKYVKYTLIHMGRAFDVLLFIGSVAAMATLGITAAGAITFTGLGFTIYILHIREKHNNNKNK
jgi:hypothetical protein